MRSAAGRQGDGRRHEAPGPDATCNTFTPSSASDDSTRLARLAHSPPRATPAQVPRSLKRYLRMKYPIMPGSANPKDGTPESKARTVATDSADTVSAPVARVLVIVDCGLLTRPLATPEGLCDEGSRLARQRMCTWIPSRCEGRRVTEHHHEDDRLPRHYMDPTFISMRSTCLHEPRDILGHQRSEICHEVGR